MPERPIQQNRLHNVWLIARREYLERIRTKAFLIATLVIPMILGAVGFGGGVLANRTKGAGQLIILGGQPTFDADLKRAIEADKVNQLTASAAPDDEQTRAQLDARLTASKDSLVGYLRVLPPHQGSTRPTFIFNPRSAADANLKAALKADIRYALLRERLRTQGVQQGEIDALMTPVTLDTTRLGDSTTAINADYAMFFLMYFIIMQFGMNTARSIIEEKGSRIFEVLLATIQPEEMLAGKILGVGAVGLTQVLVWMTAAAAYGAYVTAISGGSLLLTPTQIFFFIVYFLFGFIIYTSIAATLGAMTNSEQELQQLNLFLVVPLSACLLCLPSIVRSPDSVFSRIASLVPFCSPLLMNFRISNGHPQPWEIVLSFILMTATVLAILWIASRIYRVGILMYGKKPNLPEIMRWVRYS
jgi:ABC-2 type transport system permease protein